MLWKKRNKNKGYTCEKCGQEHNNWPALAFNAPESYYQLSEEERNDIADLSSDFCLIEHPEQTDLFIRVRLIQKVNDSCDDLEYVVWVSVSAKSFAEYIENFKDENYEDGCFGWLSNHIPDYNFDQPVPMNVHINNKGWIRPVIEPHSDHDHPFVKDFYNGISKKEAERRIRKTLSDNEENHSRKM